MNRENQAQGAATDVRSMLELRVLNGLHQGAALPLIGGQWTLGASDNHDLALHDPAFAGGQFALERNDEGWQLQGTDGLITDAEGHQSATAQLQVNQPFALGQVWLCLTPVDSRWQLAPIPQASVPVESDEPQPEAEAAPLETRSRPSYGKRLAVAGLIVTIASSAWAFTRPANDITQPLGKNPALAVDAGIARAAARKRLQHMLSDRLLDADVTISDDGNNMVLNGTLKGEAFALYQRMLAGARAQLPEGLTLADKVNVFQTHLPFVIVQVLKGPQAHIVTADGRRMFVGDERDGIKLVSIDDKTIEFDGGAQRYKVAW